MRRPLSISISIAIATALILLPSPAWAGIGGGNGDPSAGDDGGGVTVGVTDPGAPDTLEPGGSAPSDGDCVDITTPGTVEAGPDGSTDGYWTYNSCNVADGIGGAVFWIPTPPVPDPGQLAQQAKAKAPWPILAVSMDPSPKKLLVHLPIWMRITNGWQEVTASATAGITTATITAQPTRSMWSMGDGAKSVTCVTKGTAYDPTKSWSANLHNRTCGYEYDHASSATTSGHFTVAVTITYDVTWTSSTGASGSLGTYDRSNRFLVSVGQVEALEN